jgi:hypothetical protein
MPFSLFVGVNNHFQRVLYNGVLMCDEKNESFEWVFKEFVKIMTGEVLHRRCDVDPRRRRAAYASSRLFHQREWRCTVSLPSRYRHRRCSIPEQVGKSIIRFFLKSFK